MNEYVVDYVKQFNIKTIPIAKIIHKGQWSKQEHEEDIDVHEYADILSRYKWGTYNENMCTRGTPKKLMFHCEIKFYVTPNIL